MKQEIISREQYERYCAHIRSAHESFMSKMHLNFGRVRYMPVVIKLYDKSFGGYFVEKKGPEKISIISVGTRAMITPHKDLYPDNSDEWEASEPSFTKLKKARYICFHETAHHLHRYGNQQGVENWWSHASAVSTTPEHYTIEIIAELGVRVYKKASEQRVGDVWMENDQDNCPLDKYVEILYMIGSMHQPEGEYHNPLLEELATAHITDARRRIENIFGKNTFTKIRDEYKERQKNR